MQDCLVEERGWVLSEVRWIGERLFDVPLPAVQLFGVALIRSERSVDDGDSKLKAADVSHRLRAKQNQLIK